MTTPTIGRIVIYVLSQHDVDRINDQRARSEGLLRGNNVHAGDAFPMMICRVWDTPEHHVNGRVLLDGTDTLWVTSVTEKPTPELGYFVWPTRSAGLTASPNRRSSRSS